MIDEIGQGLAIINRARLLMKQGRRGVKTRLNDLEKCAVRYKTALKKKDTSQMTQCTTEFDELVENFRNRFFQGIEHDRDAQLHSTFARTRLHEDVMMGIIEEQRSIASDPELERELLVHLDTLIGQLRGISKSLD
jgi:hypothetical protein